MRPTVSGLSTSKEIRSRLTDSLAPVAPRPFGAVADRSDRGQDQARDHRAAAVGRGVERAEGEVGRIEGAAVLAQHQRERPDAAGPHHVGKRTGLAAALQLAFMIRPQLVHMVRLIAAAAGIVEAEHAGDQQRGLVMRDGVGAGQHTAGLAVKPLAVGEEQAILRRKLPAHVDSLARHTSSHQQSSTR